ncbi:MAG: MBL fold metallo-hydrolase [Candidatus Omnitrophica bacterium]|nr:MBL fold metallo-hydrolase [Candidatus Omnitrophota bacterium]
MQITFLGAAGTVTGSRFLIEQGNTKILIDCGLFQERDYVKRNWEPFPVAPADIQCILLTHAHTDHCGYLPKLVSDGFRGLIYCTAPTSEITKVSLLDTANLQEADAVFKRKRHQEEKRQGPFPEVPLYTVADAQKVFPLFHPISFGQEFLISNEFKVTYHEAGHILGAAMLQLKFQDAGKEKIIIFSGDIGRWNRPIIDDPHLFERADYVVMEATYGNKKHEDEENASQKFEKIIQEAERRGGNIIIPTFAIERAQELLYHLQELYQQKRIPPILTFLDSPMAIQITKVFNKYSTCFDEEAKLRMQKTESIFSFPLLKMTETIEQSKAINVIKGTCLIMAGSGMCNGGRIKHHLLHNITREESTILFVGYQAKGTLGREILEKPSRVRIFGKTWPVRARIEKINGFSAHADREELLRWVKGFCQAPQKIFIVHAESIAAESFSSLLKEEIKTDVKIAQYLERIELE